MTDQADIQALEDRRWAAQIDADLVSLDELLAPELSYTHSNGVVDTKASYIKAIDDKTFDYQSEQRSDTATLVIGDMAMVTGRAQFHVIAAQGAREIHLDARYTAIWVRRDGTWQFLAWQSTPAS